MTAWRWLVRNGWLIQHCIWVSAATLRMFTKDGRDFEAAMAIALLCLLLHRSRR